MPKRQRGLIGRIVYPWGNSTPAKIVNVTFTNDNIRYTIKFLEDCIANFGWYSHLIFAKGEVIENLKEEQLFDDPQR